MNSIIRAMALAAIIILAVASPKVNGDMNTTKKSRSLTTDAEIRQMRENIAKYPKAKEIAGKIIKAADEWMTRSDRYVWEMIPSYDIPRAFNSSFDGCPVHGAEYFKYGNYSWKMDPFNKPWKLVCPVGGEEYPSNDFMAYYKTKDKSLLTGPYADDGWGWRKDGDKYKHWFVGYYCHWLWSNYIIPGIENLTIAYEITGDPKYARKALVMLDRVADFYPQMDHNKQSRYAQEFAPDYQGKIVNLIWETGTITSLTRSYDRVFDAVSSDAQFTADDKDSPLNGRSNADIRRNIEQNLLMDGVKAIYEGKIRGNYGMHQQSLATLALVLQDDDTLKQARDFILNHSGESYNTEGFNYAMSNMVLREGMSHESAPGYCLIWCSCLSNVGVLLDKMGVNVFADPKLKRMFTIYMQLQALGRWGPTIGDTGSVTASGSGNLSVGMARVAYERIKDPVFAAYLLKQNSFGESTLTGYDSLKQPVLDEKTLRKASRNAPDLSSGSRNLGGYGLGILEAGSGDRKMAISTYYGPTRGGHCHADKLFFELYAFGKKLIPDLGYPQFAAEYKGRTAWESHTISHTTVTVNGKRQSVYSRGVLNQFSVTPDVKMLDVSVVFDPDAAAAGFGWYNRRTMLLIGGETESPYLVDIYNVQGGHSHDYSLHGFDGQFSTDGIDLKAQTKGTLAGEDVPYSYLYDDPELEKPDKTRSFSSYEGSGYSYLYNVSRGRSQDTWSATWQTQDCGIRAFFPRQDIKEAVTADGRPPKRPGNPESLKYVLLRNSGKDDLASRFVAVLQPFKPGDPPLQVKRLPTNSEMIEVKGAHGTDYIYLRDAAEPGSAVGDLHLTAKGAVIRMGPNGEMKSAFTIGGGGVDYGSLQVRSDESLIGQVKAYDPKTNEVTLAVVTDATRSKFRDAETVVKDPKRLIGMTILFGMSNYLVHSARIADGKLIVGLGEDSPIIGKIEIDRIEHGNIITRSLLPFASSGCYRRRWVANEDFSICYQISNVDGGTVSVSGGSAFDSMFGDKNRDGHRTAYLCDVGPGGDFTIPATCWVGRDSTNKWQVESNTPAKVSLPDGTRL